MAVQKREVYIGAQRAGTKEYVEITDARTGEIIDAFWRERRTTPSGRPPAGEGRKPQFLKVYRTNWRDVVRRKRLTPYEAGVFAMCLAFVGWESTFLVHPATGENLSESQLAELVGISRPQLHDTLHALRQKGLLAQVKCSDGGPSHWLMNSNVVFWGKRIKDLSEHKRFTEGCPYEPPVQVRYREAASEPKGREEATSTPACAE